MKTKNKLITALALLAIITLSLMATACKDDPPKEDPKKVQPDTTRPLTFTDTPNVTPPPTYSVTITSLDKFTDTEWNTLCDKVVDKIKQACITGGTSAKAVVESSQNTKVVLGNNFTYNWEIKTGEYRTMYIKTSSIDTVDFIYPIAYMSSDDLGNG
jgi:hypothetical protein